MVLAAQPQRRAQVGDVLPTRTFTVTLPDLVRYAGAGGDFNPIHWNARAARAAGLPDVIAHGMFTMAQAARLVTDYFGDPGAIAQIAVRFSAPVVVPDDGIGASIEIGGMIESVAPDGAVRVGLTATCGGVDVLAAAAAVVRVR